MIRQYRILCMSSETFRQSGLPRRQSELIAGMRDRGWIVQTICLNPYTTSKNMITRSLVTSSLRIPMNIVMILSFLMKIVKIDKKFNCDAIICFTTLHSVIALLYKAIFNKAKVIFCDRADSVEGKRLEPIHNWVTRLQRPWELSFLRITEKETCLRCDIVIFNSESRRVKVEKGIGKHLSNCRVIPNNANSSWVREWLSEVSEDQKRLKDMSSLFDGRKPIGFVGNLYEIGNGLDILLEAFQLVLTKIPEAILVIVGDGPDKLKLKRKVHDLNLTNHVIFSGWVSNPLFYVMNFKVMILPSRGGGHCCPNAILESLMCNVPVIGACSDGIPEILKHDEFLFQSENTRELADKIVAILTGQFDPSHVNSLVTQLRRSYIFDWQETMIKGIENGLTKSFDYSISTINVKNREPGDKSGRLNILTRCSQYTFAQVIILISFFSYVYSSIHPLIASISILSGWLNVMMIPGYLFLNLLIRQKSMPLYEKFLYSVPLSVLISSLMSLTLFGAKMLHLSIPLLFVICECMIALSVIRAYFTH